jgi:hypothetical protein
MVPVALTVQTCARPASGASLVAFDLRRKSALQFEHVLICYLGGRTFLPRQVQQPALERCESLGGRLVNGSEILRRSCEGFESRGASARS